MSAIAPTVSAQPVAGHIGAEIEGIDLAAPLDAATIEGIWAALTKHKVIFFRDQHLDDDTQVAFARRMGALTTAHPTIPSVRDQAHVLDINAAHGGKANQWHTDVTFLDRPRVTLGGDVPVAVDGQRSEALTGDSRAYTS